MSNGWECRLLVAKLHSHAQDLLSPDTADLENLQLTLETCTFNTGQKLVLNNQFINLIETWVEQPWADYILSYFEELVEQYEFSRKNISTCSRY